MHEALFFHNRTQLENYCKLELGGKTVEEMHILHMDAEGQLIEDQLHSIGTNDETPFYIREIIRHALDLQTKNIAFVHNHPRSQLLFSIQDIQITKAAIQQLSAMGIEFVDHYLVSGGILYSMKENHWLDDSSSKPDTPGSGNSGM